MSSRRSRRAQAGHPRYSGDDFDLDADMETYSDASAPSRRSTRFKSDKEDDNELEPRTTGDRIDEYEEVTRCICGNDDLVIPKNSHGEFNNVDTGFFIQCETCSVWQHGFCVGIKDESHSPEKYWCEQCKPENHTLFTDKFNTRRSKYDPEHANSNTNKKNLKRKNGRSSGRNSDSNQEQIGLLNPANESFEGDDEQSKKKQRKRYYTTYEEQLKKALEESAKESGVAPEEVNVSSTEGVEGHDLRNSSVRKTRTRMGGSDNNESNADDDNDEEEEKNEIKKDNEYDQSTTEDQIVKLEDKQKIRDLKKMKVKGIQSSNLNNVNSFEDSPSNDVQNQTNTKTTSKISNSSNSKRAIVKKPKKEVKPPSTIDDKPFKTNIPSARISMNEMNRRIFSIIDFVSNTQTNLTNEEDFKNNLFQMNDNEMVPELVELKTRLVECYNESVGELDNLTEMLNVWQSEFA